MGLLADLASWVMKLIPVPANCKVTNNSEDKLAGFTGRLACYSDRQSTETSHGHVPPCLGGIKSNVARYRSSIQTSGMGLHDTLLDFSFRALTGTALGFAVIVFSFLGIPRRSEDRLTRPVPRAR